MVSNLRPNQQRFITNESLQHQAVMPLLYFEVFSYPLTLEEIYQFGHHPTTTLGELKAALAEMVKAGLIFNYQEFYLSRNQPEWVEQRRQNNERAKQALQRAKNMTQLIRRFPFVRGVALSGSLSKNVMPEDGDIDYFIITQPGRLWVARTLLVLFKKVFLLNSKKYFCVNYFVDEDHLKIEEQNRFTATEMATLLPVYNTPLYHHFFAVNKWVKAYFPRSVRRSFEKGALEKNSRLRGLFEKVLNGKIGDQLDTFFMKRTIQYWNSKFKTLDPNNFSVALKSRRYVSKHHPQDFQNRVMKAYEQRIQEFEQKHQLDLDRSGVWQVKINAQ
ncbi:MAG: nucleotidyltransferase domain-containing protein [Bacteroidota bacterium]